MEEIWRDIPNLGGLYQASTKGRIRSVEHNFKTRGFNVFYLGKKSGKVLTPIMRDRYYAVMICENNKGRKEYVHKLVALTFPEICGNPFPGAEVMHLDDNCHNNVATNLRFVTQRENVNWGTHNERMIKNRKGKNACKPVLQYTLNGDFVKEYPSCNEAARQTGIDDTTMWRCCNGIKESANGYIWKYKPQP